MYSSYIFDTISWIAPWADFPTPCIASQSPFSCELSHYNLQRWSLSAITYFCHIAYWPNSVHTTGVYCRALPSKPTLGKTTCSNISVLVLLLSDDPGPAARDIYPCGHCELPVNWSHQATWQCYVILVRYGSTDHVTVYQQRNVQICITLVNSMTTVWISRVKQVLLGWKNFIRFLVIITEVSIFATVSWYTRGAMLADHTIRSSSVALMDTQLLNKNRKWCTVVLNRYSVIN